MQNVKKILIVDDEKKLVDVVKSYLEKEGHIIIVAFNGKDGLELFDNEEPDLVLLDLMLTDISGEEICKRIRRRSRVPIIMLTAKVEENNILEGFNIGTDDYITKPFSPRELVARVTALLRRVDQSNQIIADIIDFNNGDLVINCVNREVRKNNEIINLTPGEFKLLTTLVKYPQKVFTREELVFSALGDEYDGYDRIIDTHIKNIRQKLEDNPKEPKYILTVHGVGYKFGGE